MKLITANGATFGPFNNVEIVDDSYIADGVVYQFSVIGDDHSCIDMPQDYIETKTTEAIPDYVTARQARHFLLMNNMLDLVNSAVDAEGESAKIDWEFSTEIYREYPLVKFMSNKFGWTKSQVDNFFISASKL